MTEIDYTNPPDCFVWEIDTHSLLPQQEPFVMVGNLKHFDMVKVATSTRISPDNLFVENGRMTAEGLIENIAQTCAARIGYINKYILKKGIDIGFIGAIRNFTVEELPLTGAEITTQVEVMEEVFGMLLVNAKVSVEGRTIASTDMKIAIKEG